MPYIANENWVFNFLEFRLILLDRITYILSVLYLVQHNPSYHLPWNSIDYTENVKIWFWWYHFNSLNFFFIRTKQTSNRTHHKYQCCSINALFMIVLFTRKVYDVPQIQDWNKLRNSTILNFFKYVFYSLLEMKWKDISVISLMLFDLCDWDLPATKLVKGLFPLRYTPLYTVITFLLLKQSI